MSNKKMTIEEAANYFNISKEAIHNRIRRGTLKSIIENDIKYVFVHSSIPKNQKIKKTTTINDNFHLYLQEQNKELQQKIEKLENETRTLREEKEQLLVEERRRIEQIYKEKDIQLNNILNAISSKFLLEAKPIENENTYDVEIATEVLPEETPHKIISLQKYLKKQKVPKQKREKIIKKIKKSKKKEKRFTFKKDKILIDIAMYDYKDLF